MKSDPPVTLKDVAAMAGVHPATASRALNPQTRPLVSDDTAHRILAAADSLGYRPNTVARSLRTRRSHTVGVLIPDLNNPLFPPIVRGIEDRLAADGYVALIGNTDADDVRERLVFERMRARHVDGFVLATAHLHSPLLDDALAAQIPVVLVNRHARGYGFPAVSVDNERGMALAVSHLAALGHRRIAHICGPQDISTGLSRYRGFLAAMAEHGLDVDPDLVVYASAYSLDEGDRCCRDLLAAPGGCTAIAAANDMLAVGSYAALEAAGLSCPADISIVGFNDMPFIDRLRPPLTSVSFPHYQLGAEAGRLILEQIAAGSEQRSAVEDAGVEEAVVDEAVVDEAVVDETVAEEVMAGAGVTGHGEYGAGVTGRGVHGEGAAGRGVAGSADADAAAAGARVSVAVGAVPAGTIVAPGRHVPAGGDGAAGGAGHGAQGGAGRGAERGDGAAGRDGAAGGDGAAGRGGTAGGPADRGMATILYLAPELMIRGSTAPPHPAGTR